MTRWLTLFVLVIVSVATRAQDTAFVRYPALNSDGSKLAFSYQGDIWMMPAAGGVATRLTIHEGYEGWPQWTRDDKTIAFSGERFGNYDVFRIPASGGTATRLTYHSASDILCDITPDGKFLFTTSREFRQVERDLEVYSIPPSGGTPSRMLDALGTTPAVSKDGKLIAFVRGGGNSDRQAYRGPGNLEIWIYDSVRDRYIKATDFDGHDFLPRWAPGGHLYFLSSRSGVFNIYRMSIGTDGTPAGEAVQVTQFKDDGVRFFSLSADGTTLVMECGIDIYLVHAEGGTPSRVPVSIRADDRLDPVVHRTFTENLSEYTVSPNGTLIAFVVRGEIFVKENNKDRSRTVNLSDHPYRDWQADWLNDSTLIFVSDREGQNELYLVRSADRSQPNLFRSLKHEIVRLTSTPEDESYPVVSPDGGRVAYEIGRGLLVVAEIDPRGVLSNPKVLLKGWSPPENVRWSPDGKWLAYSLTDLDFNREIYIHAADNGRPAANVSMHPRGDYAPVWSPDGRKLAFVSERNNRDADIWFVWLREEDWEKTKQDWEEKEEGDPDREPEEKEKKDGKSKKPPEVKIDFEEIHQRLVQVTRAPGDESNFAVSPDGGTFYFVGVNPAAKGSDLYSAKWDGSKIEAITSGGQNPSSVMLSRDGKALFFTRKGKLAKYALKEKKDENLPYAAPLDVDHGAERAQIFDDAWRALSTGFYDPGFHGQDWRALRRTYRPRCLAATTHKDFQDQFNLMLAELNASHLGMRGGDDRADTQQEKTGWIGAELEPAPAGVRIRHVVPRSPADRSTSRLRKGDVITAVNGETLTEESNVHAMFTNTADRKILLNVRGADGKAGEVVIRPATSPGDGLYNEWVEARKRMVDTLSGGRLGYLHIRGMGWDNFEQFERELTARGFGKEGIVIDVRYNGGGWITDYLMTVLGYRQHAYTIPRGAAGELEGEKSKFRGRYPLGERLPYAAWLKPSIALCNRNSYSNAEIFSHAYKNLGLGTLVGTPTYGAVISTGSYSLIDGSTVRMPGRGWYVLRTDLNMENGPAVPDIVIDESPDAKARGRDEQLERAVAELLGQIDAARLR